MRQTDRVGDLRVAIDGRNLQYWPPGGVARGLRAQLQYLVKDADVTLLLDGNLAPISVEGADHVLLRAPRIGRSVLWLQAALPPFLKTFDGVFHCPFNALPYRHPVPMIVTIHDLFFEDAPTWVGGRAKAQSFRIQARHAARIARLVLAPSRWTADQIADRYDVPAERLAVVPNAVEATFRPDVDEDELRSLRTRFGLRDRWVVALGGPPRRQLDVAIEAWRLATTGLGDDAPSLVTVGGDAGHPAMDGRVDLGFLEEGVWPALLAGADALVFPTLSEGFGMPAAEAAAVGTPVVCARVGALPEVLGDGAVWCESPRTDDIAAGLRALLDDPALAAEVRRAGLEHAAAAPTWEDRAAGLVDAYRAASA